MTSPPPLPGSVKQGIIIGIAIAVVVYVVVLLNSRADLVARMVTTASMGILQYLWILPLAWILGSRGKRETAKGLWIASGCVFLLSTGGCFAWMALTNG